MSRLKAVVAILALTWSLALVAPCHAQVECLQFLVGVQYDSHGNPIAYWYYADEYSSATICNSSTFETALYVLEATPQPNPQSCPNCQAEYAPLAKTAVANIAGSLTPGSVKGADKSIAVVTQKTPLLGNKLPTYDYKDAAGKTYKVDPNKGFTTISVRWINVTAANGKTIPVKICAGTFDYSLTGLPPEAYAKVYKSVRPVVIGFEVDGLPNGEKPATYTPTRIGSNKYSATVKLDDESPTTVIFTHNPLF